MKQTIYTHRAKMTNATYIWKKLELIENNEQTKLGQLYSLYYLWWLELTTVKRYSPICMFHFSAVTAALHN